MFSRTLARVSAAFPSSVKYRLTRLKSIYISLLQVGESETTVTTAAGVLQWRIDELTSQEFLLGSYEQYMQKAFQRFVQPGFTVFDIGAHAGFHSLFCGLLVGNFGRVLAFEPNPKNRNSMALQLQANPQLPITLLPFALSDHDASLNFDTSNAAEGKLTNEGDTLVEARTLDGLISSGILHPPDIIKIDVEGHEKEVLKGSRMVLEKYRPIILCDDNDGSTFELVSSELRTLGYRMEGRLPITAVPSSKSLDTCSSPSYGTYY
jgi:FkbM family methyltransferase